MNYQLRKILTAAFLTFALCVSQSVALAQTAERINLAEGKTSATVKGSGNQAYIFHVGAGQTCRIQLVSARNSATLEVLDAAGSDLTEGSDGHSFEGSFDEAGDLKINISASGKTAFTLKITIK